MTSRSPSSPRRAQDLPTPALVVDVDLLGRNIERMASYADAAGLVLRPHAKTHKSPAVAALQRSAGATGLTVATVSEAEVFAAAGHTDLFVAYPLWLDADRARRLRALMQHAVVSVGVDSPEGARRLAAAARPRRRPAARRSSRSTAASTAAAPRPRTPAGWPSRPLTRSRRGGVFTFPGHGYCPDARAAGAVTRRTPSRVAPRSLHRARSRPARGQRRLDPDGRALGGRGDDRAAARGLRLRRRPAVGARHDRSRAGGADLPRHGDQHRRRPGRARRRQQGARRGPARLGERPRSAAGPPGARVTLLSEHHAVVDWDGSRPAARVCRAAGAAGGRAGTIVAVRGANT